ADEQTELGVVQSQVLLDLHRDDREDRPRRKADRESNGREPQGTAAVAGRHGCCIVHRLRPVKPAHDLVRKVCNPRLRGGRLFRDHARGAALGGTMARKSRGGIRPTFTDQEALLFHSQGRPGKLEVVATKPMATQRDLSLAYSPGVAVPVLAIAEDESKAYDYTTKGNFVAVI